nr:LURP-one-related family protein [uncultured Acetatifactor sp.]
MKLLFKQRLFSWFDSYDIYREDGGTAYTVQGQLSWGHCLKIFDPQGNEIGTVKERVLTFLPKFELYMGDRYIGCISKELSFLKPRYEIDCMGWQVEGDFMEWDYRVTDRAGRCVATVSKELFNWTDTYTIEVVDPGDALAALMLVLAIDAEKCSEK